MYVQTYIQTQLVITVSENFRITLDIIEDFVNFKYFSLYICINIQTVIPTYSACLHGPQKAKSQVLETVYDGSTMLKTHQLTATYGTKCMQ